MTTYFKLTPAQTKSILFAAGIVIIIKLLPLLRFVSVYYNISVHELGHSACAWLFGYVSIPLYDFAYGGGIAYQLGRPLVLQFIVFALVSALLWRINRLTKNKLTVVLVAIWMVYLLVFITPAQDFLIIFMGQGGEIVGAFLLGWFALSKSRTKFDYKTVLYHVLALAIWLEVIIFPIKLLVSSDFKANYIIGKANVESDLVRLAEMTGLPMSVYTLLLLVLALMSLYWLTKLTDKPFIDVRKVIRNLFKTGIKQT